LIDRYKNDGRLTVNPYAYFGQPSIWPRGYPLSEIYRDPPTEFEVVNASVSIQQGLANGDPDVDALFRLTRAKGNFVLFTLMITENYNIYIEFNNAIGVALPQSM
jgi:hypothetical protein